MGLMIGETGRGFALVEFKDMYQQGCSLQKSSLADRHAVWLGVDNTGPEIKDINGKVNSDVGVRMHLTQDQVYELLPILQKFVDTGELY